LVVVGEVVRLRERLDWFGIEGQKAVNVWGTAVR